MTDQAFVGVRVVGGLLPADVLSRLVAARDVPGLGSGDFHLGSGESVREAANRSWSYLTGTWAGYRAALEQLPETDRATTLTRDRWLQQLFGQLGYGRVPATPAGGIVADGKAFAISHRWEHVPVHLLGWRVELDRKTAGVAGAADAAPQSLVQECLNRSDEHLWAVLSNGRVLRLLRDSTSLVGSAYVEFDLEAIFDGELFSDFLLLFTLCHQSRFEQLSAEGGPAECWLERWRTDALESGTRALEQLRDGVREAIETLGTGFLQHPDNGGLREDLASGALTREDYRQALLRLVYRLLFLFVAEDRNALLDPRAPAEARARYDGYFATARLRSLARRRRGGRHGDLWQALVLVTDGLGAEQGRPELGLPGIGGLFEPGALDFLSERELANEALLDAVRSLCLVRERRSGKLRVVDYRNLGAEELGSVYESLLEYVPQHDPGAVTFSLVLLSGNERKTTGSYYTPTSLIETLLDSALEPLLTEALKAADPREALLSLTVCDPACGSGHFLVAAARRIAKRVATVDTADPEPPPERVRAALREVVGRCIYGVDLNPLAADLAKVSLWLEAMQPGRPLAFLDAQIKVGNALLGTTPRLLDDGIPDNAFKPIEGDDKKFATSLLKRSRSEHPDQDDLFIGSGIDIGNQQLASRVRDMLIGPTLSLADAHEQAKRQRELETSPELQRARTVADAWCAAFVQPKTPSAAAYITQGTLLAFQGDSATISDETRNLVADLTARYQFFHWHLEFPHIFPVPAVPGADTNHDTGWDGGFSCILGNPPWDTLSPDAKEFFSSYEPQIRHVSKPAQEVLKSALLDNPAVAREWTDHRRNLYATAHFLKSSGAYTMYAPGNLGKGDFNVYRSFVERALRLISKAGRAGQIVPSGLYQGANAAALRKALLTTRPITLLLGFLNMKRVWFPDIHPETRFCLYVARGRGDPQPFVAGFGLQTVVELTAALARTNTIDPQAVLATPEEYPISEGMVGGAADLTSFLMSCHPSFGQEDRPEGREYMREIDMGNDRDRFSEEANDALPLYEGRMIAPFDHRAKEWVSGRGRSAVWGELRFGKSEKRIAPQWYIPLTKVPPKARVRCNDYRVGFCDVTSPQTEYPLTSAMIPPATISGHKVPTITFRTDWKWSYPSWLAVANSLVVNFLARRRVALTMSLTILDSMPFPVWSGPSDPRVRCLTPVAADLALVGSEMLDYRANLTELGLCRLSPVAEAADEVWRVVATAAIQGYVATHVFGLETDQIDILVAESEPTWRAEKRRFGNIVTPDLIFRYLADDAPEDLLGWSRTQDLPGLSMDPIK